MLRCLRVGHLVPARAAAVQRVQNSAENMETKCMEKVQVKMMRALEVLAMLGKCRNRKKENKKQRKMTMPYR